MESIQTVGIIVTSVMALALLFVTLRSLWLNSRQKRRLRKRGHECDFSQNH